MAALLVGMAVMAVLLSVAMPTWSHMIRRDNEEELVFRGTQYARAINQYQRKFANASPASLDVLIEQRLLRKKFRDPLSPNKDGQFQLLYLNTQATGTRAGGAGRTGGSPNANPGTGMQTGATLGTTPSGGILGVASKNTRTSIRVYKGKNKYNEWQFVGMEQTTQAGPGVGGGAAGGRGSPNRGGRGGRDGGPGGFGVPGNRGGSGGGGMPDRGSIGGRAGDGGFGGRGPATGPSPQR